MRAELKRLPSEFLDRLSKLVPHSKLNTIINTFAEGKPTTFRVNILKSSRNDVEEYLHREHLLIQKVHWYSDAYILIKARLKELQKTNCYVHGEIYVQNLSSMIPSLILDPQPGEKILDITAAPGSKTTQMAALMKNEGEILANDNNPLRYAKLANNLKIQSAQNVQLNLAPAETIGKRFHESFDRVLADVPCGAEGRFDIRDPASYGYWKLSIIKNNAKLQKKIIRSAILALKPGGVLVYSTCTFSPEENEEVVDWAVQNFPDAITVEKINFKLPNQMSGLSQWQGQKYHPSVTRTLRILPTETMEGFFVAKIRKNHSTPLVVEQPTN